MLGYQHSGFSVDAAVCIEADDRAALERLLRYCAPPPFAIERFRYFGVLAQPPPRQAETANLSEGAPAVL
jgi:hypothetical protein